MSKLQEELNTWEIFKEVLFNTCINPVGMKRQYEKDFPSDPIAPYVGELIDVLTKPAVYFISYSTVGVLAEKLF